MIRWSQCILALVLIAILVTTVSCGHDQQLVGITIVPDTENFGASNIPVDQDAGLSVQLRALGQYIHPPVTKDITDKVTWSTNTPGMVTVNSAGLITVTGLECGGTLISATVQTNSSAGNQTSSGALITSTMQANVACFSGTGAGGSGPTLAVNLSGAGTGTVTSNPAGITCPGTCSASFTSGTAVNLTAAANSGSRFGGWSGCDSVNAQTCVINQLTSDRAVTVTFN